MVKIHKSLGEITDRNGELVVAFGRRKQWHEAERKCSEVLLDIDGACVRGPRCCCDAAEMPLRHRKTIGKTIVMEL